MITDEDLRAFLDAEEAARTAEVAAAEEAHRAYLEEIAAERAIDEARRALEEEAAGERRAALLAAGREHRDSMAALSRRLARSAALDSLAPELIRAEVTRLRRVEQAKSYLAIERARAVDVAPAVGLSDFLETPDLTTPFIVDRVWPVDGNIAFSAQKKAGKSRIIQNLTRSLADGDPFLDVFAVLGQRRVALLDFELPEPMLRAWLRGQKIQRHDNVALVESLKGRAGSFAVTDDAVRSRWATKLRDCGTEVLILDPLRPVLRALKLDEWREIGVFLDAFDALKAEAGIREGLIAHHHGHHAQRAAGDSSFEGWGDAIWNLTRDDPNDPRSFRFFDAYGRDVDVDQGLVSLYDEHRLVFAASPTSVAEAKATVLRDRLVDWLSQHGQPAKKAEIVTAGIRGVSDKSFTTVVDEAISAGLVAVTVGEHNAKWYSPTNAGVVR